MNLSIKFLNLKVYSFLLAKNVTLFEYVVEVIFVISFIFIVIPFFMASVSITVVFLLIGRQNNT